jgi:hypothetical protein
MRKIGSISETQAEAGVAKRGRVYRSIAFILPAVISLGLCAAGSDVPGTRGTGTNPRPAVQEASPAQPQPIQDNSFLIEEAYNQEFGVVQHINTFSRSWNSHEWVYTFTQEWPVPGEAHQLSYTVSYVNSDSTSASPGIGDLALNYRHQLAGNSDSRLAFAPRLTLLLPTGNARFGRGFGGSGVQTNLPLSWTVNKRLVTHWNAGATIIPAAKNEFGDRATATGHNLGQSFIWLVHPRFNVLFETLWTGSESVVAKGRTQRSHDLLLSPGIRWAHNLANGLQIVPGIGIPIGVGPSAGEKGLFVYLSFEHPFRARHPLRVRSHDQHRVTAINACDRR